MSENPSKIVKTSGINVYNAITILLTHSGSRLKASKGNSKRRTKGVW